MPTVLDLRMILVSRYSDPVLFQILALRRRVIFQQRFFVFNHMASEEAFQGIDRLKIVLIITACVAGGE